MRHFFGRFNNGCGERDQFDTSLADMFSLSDNTTISYQSFSFTTFHQSKALNDIIIKHDTCNSWLMLIGMPLLKNNDDIYRQRLIDNFLHDEKSTILSDIDGHFALIGYNSRNNTLSLGTDFNSFIPIFYARTPEGFVFCSSELALARFLQAEIDPVGFAQAIHVSGTWGTATRFKPISKMGPCEILTVDPTQAVTCEPYWQPADEDQWQDGFDGVLERWMALLDEAVRLFYDHARIQDTVWTDFTGGEDARLLVAQCQALELPYRARVDGFPGNGDIEVARRAAQQAQLDLRVEPYQTASPEQVVAHAPRICLRTDGYGSFMYSATRFATEACQPPHAFRYLHFAGTPGGEAYRGTEYKRAKLLFPSRMGDFDYKFFVKFKMLLDYVPGLLAEAETDFVAHTYAIIEDKLGAVEKFPAGTRFDHILRECYTCIWGLPHRNPFYLPLGLKALTRSIYTLPPRFKRGSRLTRACTERLFPQLAYTKTEKGVPTLRRSLSRLPLFLPEYGATLKHATHGARRRLLRFGQASTSLAGRHRIDLHGETMQALLTAAPYADWFASTKSMLTGPLYEAGRIEPMLEEAKRGQGRYVDLLGRIINQELACRYVYDGMP